jgi:AcrR family transcriptional regulator
MGPAKRTEREIQEMRERILDATLELLRQEGLKGVSIRKIADRIGVSHMLLYRDPPGAPGAWIQRDGGTIR